ASCAEQLALAGSDSASAAGGAITICMGCGAGGWDALTYTPPPGFTGVDTFNYTAGAGTTAVASATASIKVQPILPAVTPSIPHPGIFVSYYALPELEVLPDFTQYSPGGGEIADDIDYPSTDGPFAGSGLADLVGAVFDGYVVAPTTGLYTFFLESDDGSRML